MNSLHTMMSKLSHTKAVGKIIEKKWKQNYKNMFLKTAAAQS